MFRLSIPQHQFTARLHSSSAHFAVDLAPSLGSGGEGVVYMSGYTMDGSGEMFLARFEGSAGTQTWLSHFGGEAGSAHLAQSVTVVEGSQDELGTVIGAGSGSASDLGTGPGTPTVEEGSTAGRDARILVVGYNISAASAASHTSTGFTVAADTEGQWVWHSVSREADRETAIAMGSISRAGGGVDATSAFVVGTVGASEASPGNYYFLDIQEVVRDTFPTPSPLLQSVTLPPTMAAASTGEASATTGLSQGASLWLLIIAPILVVVSCILTVGYVSKQCAIAFGTSPHMDGDAIDYSAHHDHHHATQARSSRKIRAHRRSTGSGATTSDDDDAAGWPEGSPTRGTSWPRSVAAAFQDKDVGPPYRKVGSSSRTARFQREGSESLDNGEIRGGQIELRSAVHHHPSSDSPRSKDRRRQRGGLGVSSGDEAGAPRDMAAENDSRQRLSDQGESGALRWGSSGHGRAMASDEETRSHTNGNPRGDEPEHAEVDSPLQ